MKKRILQLTCVVLSTVFLAAFTACGKENVELYQYSTYGHFNYALAQWVFAKKSDETDSNTWKQITSTLTSVEKNVSVSEEDSAISKFNTAEAGAKIEINETAYSLLMLAKELYVKTDGAYNPAVGNLIDLWGFSPRFSGNYTPQYPYDREKPNEELPNEKYIEEFLSLSNFSQVELSGEDGKYYVVKPDCTVEMEGETYSMQINLGGIGKGYAVDGANEIIRAAEYEYGYFSLGGSSMCVLHDPNNSKHDNAWEIGLLKPRAELYSSSNFMSVLEKDICLSTSGDYIQYYNIEGKRYSHIINPNTGYPVNAAPTDSAGGIICASVFGLSAAEGDATTTALIVMGRDKAVSYIQDNLSDVHALFVYDNGDGTYTLYTNMEESDYTLYAEMETVKL